MNKFVDFLELIFKVSNAQKSHSLNQLLSYLIGIKSCRLNVFCPPFGTGISVQVFVVLF